VSVVGVAVAIAIGAAACGGSDDPAFCADRDALEQSLAGVRDVNVREEGIGALETQLRAVQQDANALVGSAREEFQSEASALRAAITRLESSARAAVSEPSAQSLSNVAAGVSGVASAFRELSDAVSSRC
jgi:hypothetical protein